MSQEELVNQGQYTYLYVPNYGAKQDYLMSGGSIQELERHGARF